MSTDGNARYDEPNQETLFRLTMYKNGWISWAGSKPDDVGEVLRILAEAADAGKIEWMELK